MANKFKGISIDELRQIVIHARKSGISEKSVEQIFNEAKKLFKK